MRRAVLLFVIFSAVSVCSGAVITVDDDGPADFNNIQDAIDFAVYGNTISVAAGTYIEKIILKNGVALIGQDPNITIIDGNDNGSVVISEGCDANTILEAFTITNGTATNARRRGGGMYNRVSNPAIINCAFSDNSAQNGSGMYNYYSSPIVTGCTFTGNLADGSGGGMYNFESSPTIINSTFSENSTDRSGGGIENRGGSPIVTECIFSNNSADNSGGGMYNSSAESPTVTKCTFSGNTAGIGCGGGICFNYNGNLKVTDCIFMENSADDSGGGLYNSGDSLTVINCTFIDNTTFNNGGGIYCEDSNSEVKDCLFRSNSAFGGGGMSNRYSNSTVTNCTFSGNTAFLATYGSGHGGGMDNSSSNLAVTNCTFNGNWAHYFGGGMLNSGGDYITVNNCILWANTATLSPQIYNTSDSLIITYSDIDGGWEGEGNIDADPCFAEPGYWDPNGTPADANDDFWVNGDYHLQSQAGRWDADSESWVIDDDTSPCIDAGDWMSPIGNEPFPNGGRVNMGAYGGTVEASKSYFGAEPCEAIIAGDINGDCIVNFVDLAIMALHWQQEEN